MFEGIFLLGLLFVIYRGSTQYLTYLERKARDDRAIVLGPSTELALFLSIKTAPVR